MSCLLMSNSTSEPFPLSSFVEAHSVVIPESRSFDVTSIFLFPSRHTGSLAYLLDYQDYLTKVTLEKLYMMGR